MRERAETGNIELSEPRLLVVEGQDEVKFFGALSEHLGISDLQLLDAAGETKLPGRLKALKRADWPNRQVLAVVRDADLDANAAFSSVCTALRAAGFSVPTGPLEIAEGTPRVVVMILPGGSRTGMLETLCMESVKDDPAMPCVQDYFKCLGKLELPAPGNMAKATARVFLAARKLEAFSASRVKPARRLGEAAQADVWPWDNSAFEQVKKFLRLVAD